MKVLVTGPNGFIGRNLLQHLSERVDVEVIKFTHDDSTSILSDLLVGVDFVFHLAGINRPENEDDFQAGNVVLTKKLCHAIANTGRAIPVVYTSSTQALDDNAYGVSKRAAEDVLIATNQTCGIPLYIFRLPNVFGKWARPNYNSVVATFCFNIARGLPITIANASAKLTLAYIDDVVDRFVQLMDGADSVHGPDCFETLTPQYSTTVGELAGQIEAFNKSRSTLMTECVGVGLARALYSTYISYLPEEEFTYTLPMYEDARGVFVEMLKTPNCGQFSYFTAHPGVTRGGHYHHSKTEKFLVIRGRARFKFRHILTEKTYELFTSGDKSEVVETVPGWTHDITNVGNVEMIVMLWANEVFDRQKPDTFVKSV